MLDRRASIRPMSSRNARAYDVGRFLTHSHYRVIDHCWQLLSAADLSPAERNRLMRLMRTAESELRSLDQAA